MKRIPVATVALALAVGVSACGPAPQPAPAPSAAPTTTADTETSTAAPTPSGGLAPAGFADVVVGRRADPVDRRRRQRRAYLKLRHLECRRRVFNR